jgi:hypothetical protein
VPTNPVARAHNQRDHRRLNPEKHGLKRGRREIEREVEPREQKHQHEARQHEAEPSKHAAPAAPCQHPEMDAQLVRLRSGQHLVDREQAFKMPRRNPFFFGDQFLPNHVDLRDWSAPCQRAETQEAQEEFSVRFGRRVHGVIRRVGNGGGRCLHGFFSMNSWV